MNRSIEFLQDGDGRLSATRLGFLLWTIGLLVVWIISSVTNNTLQPIPESVAAIVGVLMTGKVVQSFGENSTCSSAPHEPQPPTPAPTVVVAPVSSQGGQAT
ncbi:MAG TPA: hypothetical protein VFW68_12700 [Rhodocyclaceae bacterium]|nr:hypothetical protein [Rhodocyclaceae bacterium]